MAIIFVNHVEYSDVVSCCAQEVNKLASEIAHLHTSDVLLAKLAPGQEIHYEAFAFKGISSDHAKFQPGQAWYRFMNKITLNRLVGMLCAVIMITGWPPPGNLLKFVFNLLEC